MLDVRLATSVEVIKADNFPTTGNIPITQMASKKARAASD